MISYSLIKALFFLNNLTFLLCFNYHDEYKKQASLDDAAEFRPHHHLKQKAMLNDQLRSARISELDFMNKKLIQEIIEREMREIEKEKKESLTNEDFFGNADRLDDNFDVESIQQSQNNNPEFKQAASLLVNEQQQKADLSDVIFSPKADNNLRSYDLLFYVIVAGCAIVGLIAVAATGFCLYTMRNATKNSANVEYPAFNIKKLDPKLNSTTTVGDRRLAQSAQMYHYQHQKQQIMEMEKANSEMKNDGSDSSDEETEEGDYTVYECPGLAPTGEIEVKNPLFKEDFESPILVSPMPTSLLDTTITTPNIQEAPITPQINTDTSSTNNVTPGAATVPQTMNQ